MQEMKNVFPDSTVEKYESLISSLQLPDEDDRHVLAAAIRCKADVIVTFKLKDFPLNYLSEFDIEAQHPDVFVSNLIDPRWHYISELPGTISLKSLAQWRANYPICFTL